jgi:hypothetical protein
MMSAAGLNKIQLPENLRKTVRGEDNDTKEMYGFTAISIAADGWM